MEDEVALAEANVGRDPRTRAEDLVRTRLHMGVPPAEIPLAVSNETGVPVDEIHGMVEAQVAAVAAREKKRRRAWWIIGGVGVLVGFGLDQLLGTSRGIGTALLVVAVAMGTAMMAWLVNQIRHL